MPKRIRARVVAHLKVEYRHAGREGQGLLIDLALQGCRIQGVAGLSGGARLTLRIWLPDQAEPVIVERAIVRWIKEDEFGVSFVEISSEARVCVAQVFQVLQAAQQPVARVIPVTVVANTEQDAALPSLEVRAGRFDR